MIKEYKLFINNEFTNGESTYNVLSPFNSEIVGTVHRAGKSEMLYAIESAEKSFLKSKKLSVYERVTILEGLLDGIKREESILAETIVKEGGKPMRFARNEVSRGQVTIKTAMDVLKIRKGEILPLDIAPQTRGYTGYVKRFPIGPILGIAPFNFPLNLVLHKLAPAIATGNPIILKPASQTPITSLLLAEIINDIDIPEGFINIIPVSGKNAELLVTDDRIKKLTFTGSAEIGWHLKKLAYNKKVTLELGGNAAAIVASDSDMDSVIPRLVIGSMAHAGQVCISVQRILVEKSIFEIFKEKFVKEINKSALYGNPMDESVIIGPMIDKQAVSKVDGWVKEAINGGAQLLTGGKADGVFYQPTVLTNTKPEMKVNAEEVFAPVVTIEPFENIEDAIFKVNDSKYGLQAGIFTNRADWIEKAYAEIDAGGIIANDYPTFRIDPMPYGGIKDSGFGREGLQYAMEDMTELKLLVTKGVLDS